MEDMQPIKVAIVDDQQLIRSGLSMLINSRDDLRVTGEAANGQEALSSAHVVAADVVLMDVRMPVMDGIQATAQLLDRNDQLKIIMLTTFDLDEYALDAIDAGASGFLLKDAPPEQLLAAIDSVYHGDAVIAPSTTKRLLEHLVTPKRATSSSNHTTEMAALASLTAREREVLEAMADGLSNAEIAEKLFVSATTVKTHVGRVLTKLGARDRVQAVVFAYRAGIV
ncbi:MAG TPA: response regulator transcription factor [Enteractinococcus helveticum]|uniref:Response regulator transcription factor n=1 Tax=Enteractinococcus helveticum TaxID=1837282 RepID=A0A921K6U1_9MICC|nr:response regulator transcription factor [Enteractinococcus helveticum]HJF13868.1 response regulator transcription factor [Enteractinococcus helveticum]